jgi:hypothetical protein
VHGRADALEGSTRRTRRDVRPLSPHAEAPPSPPSPVGPPSPHAFGYSPLKTHTTPATRGGGAGQPAPSLPASLLTDLAIRFLPSHDGAQHHRFLVNPARTTTATICFRLLSSRVIVGGRGGSIRRRLSTGGPFPSVREAQSVVKKSPCGGGVGIQWDPLRRAPDDKRGENNLPDHVFPPVFWRAFPRDPMQNQKSMIAFLVGSFSCTPLWLASQPPPPPFFMMQSSHV